MSSLPFFVRSPKEQRGLGQSVLCDLYQQVPDEARTLLDRVVHPLVGRLEEAETRDRRTSWEKEGPSSGMAPVSLCGVGVAFKVASDEATSSGSTAANLDSGYQALTSGPRNRDTVMTARNELPRCRFRFSRLGRSGSNTEGIDGCGC